MADQLLLLSAAQIEAAASVGRLSRLTERLIQERAWASLELLFGQAGLLSIPLDELDAAARAANVALRDIPDANNRPGLSRDLQSVRTLAARTIVRRLRHEPLSSQEKETLALAGDLFFQAERMREAATSFERAGRDAQAADAYGALGDIEKMEACHARLDERRDQSRRIRQIRLEVDRKLTTGQRSAALTLLEALSSAELEAASLSETRIRLGAGLIRGRAVTIRRRDDPVSAIRFASVPAVMGRDPQCDLPLRDPSVSRRHAAFSFDGTRFGIEDLASRAGTWIGGARLSERLLLGGKEELTLGEHCLISLEEEMAGMLVVRGRSGLDRTLHAVVGAQPIDLRTLAPEAAGLLLILNEGVARIQATEIATSVRIGDLRLSGSCDLLHGDVLEFQDKGDRPSVCWEIV
ncbi:MAG: FHA domain-containing protein [Deltaproteobacteria bacterium]|nr:FHA domain-containing protein [Deltaproteobacteria bacterium]